MAVRNSNSTAFAWPPASILASVRLLNRNGLDWNDKYSSAIAALKNINARTAYFDGELCGIDESGLPSFARTQAASDSERGAHVVYYAFDLMYLDRRNLLVAADRTQDLARTPMPAAPDLQSNGHEFGNGEMFRTHAGKLCLEASTPEITTNGS
jgi:bifunctional non-homologous end joining protein LigD